MLPKPLKPFFNRYRRCVCGGRSARDRLIVYLEDGWQVSLTGQAYGDNHTVAEREQDQPPLPRARRRRDVRLESWKTWAYVASGRLHRLVGRLA